MTVRGDAMAPTATMKSRIDNGCDGGPLSSEGGLCFWGIFRYEQRQWVRLPGHRYRSHLRALHELGRLEQRYLQHCARKGLMATNYRDTHQVRQIPPGGSPVPGDRARVVPIKTRSASCP